MNIQFRRVIHLFASVLDDRYFLDNSTSLDTFFNYSSPLPALPHTVSLRLSLENVTELAMLTQRAILPSVQQLHVTLEGSQVDWDWRTGRAKKFSRFRLCPEDFHPTRSDLPHLRIFHLQQVSLSDIIVLIENFPSMARLKSLTVVNSNVKGISLKKS